MSGSSLVGFSKRIGRALHRAKLGILTVAVAYIVSVVIGMAMVHAGNGFALRYRDRLVAKANESSTIMKALQNNRAKTAAALDFSGNLAGGIASTAAGYWAPAVFPIAIFRGWVGGIVSVDGKHRSRLATWPEGSYYATVMCLQLLPYILAGGAGVNIGMARLRPTGDYAGAKFFGVPKEAWLDAARIYILIVPLFMLASAFEFLASPN